MMRAGALLPLVLLFTQTSVGRRRPNILEQQGQTKTTLHILDDNIVEYITKGSPKTCLLLFQEIASYNRHFEEIITGFKERKFRYVRIAHVIYEKGGPNFMKLRIDGPILLKVNGWSMNDMGELYHYLKATHKLWLEFKEVYEEVKTAVKGNWTQLKATFHSTMAPAVVNISVMLKDIIESDVPQETNKTFSVSENTTTPVLK